VTVTVCLLTTAVRDAPLLADYRSGDVGDRAGRAVIDDDRLHQLTLLEEPLDHLGRVPSRPILNGLAHLLPTNPILVMRRPT
jgi:hypothetical protein